MAYIESRFNVSLQYLHGKKSTEIKSESINYICIENDYLNTNFPVVFISLRMDSSLYDNMLANIEKNTVTLTISKYDANKDTKTMKNYIKQEFIYFFANTDSNYRADLTDELEDDTSSTQGDTNEGYREVYMGLLSIDIFNYTKKIYNEVISGTMQSIVYKYLSKLGNKMIIEPFDTNKTFKKLLIPPITGIGNLVTYLYNISSFYNSYFIFFIDLTKTSYLLSCNGKGVTRKSNDYKSVIIDISQSASDNTTKSLGLEKNTKEKCYKLNINYSDYKYNKDIYQDKEYNKIVTVDSTGKVSSVILDKYKNSKGTRTKIFRSLSGNSTKKNSLEFLSCLSNSLISITKGNIDTSVLTPDKVYSISNASANDKEDGKYVLINKQEIFRREDEKYFTSIITLKLSKAIS